MRYMMLFLSMTFIVSMLSAVAQEDNLKGLPNDVETVTLTLLGEARSEGEVGIYAVACVIQQRQLERHLSPANVCIQRKQFSCWNGQKVKDLKRQVEGTPKNIVAYAVKIAKQLVSGETLNRTIVGSANHYCVSTLNPYWVKGHQLSAQVGNHKFYKL